MINKLKKLFYRKKTKIQTFTYFIPAPPQRATGYREKQFDKIFYNFINRGYEIISFSTESCSGANQSGMWVICLVRALNDKASPLQFEEYEENNDANEIEFDL